MHPIRYTLSLAPLTLLLLVGTAQAAAPGDAAHQRYEQDRQACLSGNTWEARDTCLREAGAALQASRRGNLTSDDATRLADNALQRCDVFKSHEDQAACVARVQDESKVSGSVKEGGLLRESVTTTTTVVEPK